MTISCRRAMRGDAGELKREGVERVIIMGDMNAHIAEGRRLDGEGKKMVESTKEMGMTILDKDPLQ
jgi:hypothetical protein